MMKMYQSKHLPVPAMSHRPIQLLVMVRRHELKNRVVVVRLMKLKTHKQRKNRNSPHRGPELFSPNQPSPWPVMARSDKSNHWQVMNQNSPHLRKEGKDWNSPHL
jgi:hypothetical protein